MKLLMMILFLTVLGCKCFSIGERRKIAEIDITDQRVKELEQARRKLWYDKLINNVTINHQDCTVCFDPDASEECVCDVTDIIRHLSKSHGNKRMKSEYRKILKLAPHLRHAVFSRLREMMISYVRKIKKHMVSRSASNRVLVGMIRRRKPNGRSVFHGKQLIIF